MKGKVLQPPYIYIDVNYASSVLLANARVLNDCTKFYHNSSKFDHLEQPSNLLVFWRTKDLSCAVQNLNLVQNKIKSRSFHRNKNSYSIAVTS